MANEVARGAARSFPVAATAAGGPSGGPLGDGLRRNMAFSSFLVGKQGLDFKQAAAPQGLAGEPSRVLAGDVEAPAAPAAIPEAAPAAILEAAPEPVAASSAPQVLTIHRALKIASRE